MPSILLISRQNGNPPKTYGVVEKVLSEIMKFPFIIGIGVVLVWCCLQDVESRVINERNYLEYLNDLDRRNVEFDDIHHQWPFYSTVNEVENEGPPAESPEESANREMVMADAILARELANRHNKNYQEQVLDKLVDSYKHMGDRSDHLSQYRRHKPLEPDSLLEQARVYPEPVEEQEEDEEPENQDDDNMYSDFTSEKDEEELARPPHHSPIFTSFPRIVIEQPNNFEHTYSKIFGTEETEEQPEEDQEEEEIVRPKPTFSPSYFPRIVVPDFKVGINDLFDTKDHKNSHVHDEYTFKEGEEFPQTIDFDKVPIPQDLAEFGLSPSDPKFVRDLPVFPTPVPWLTSAPPREAVGRTYLLKTPSISKPKMNSRSDLHQYTDSLPNDEVQLESFVNKDVEMVPFKPDTETDTAGVYLIAIIAGISAAASVGLIAVGIGWYKCVNRRRLNGLSDGCIGE